MNNSHQFFENRECKYFPCHNRSGDFNCLFCYCPLYTKEHCPGNPHYVTVNGKSIKDCSECCFPHTPGNYDIIMKILAE